MGKKLTNSPLIYVIMQVSIGSIMTMAKYIPELQDLIRKDFPESKRRTAQTFSFTPNQPQIKPIEQWSFSDKEQTTGIIIDENNFFIHTTNYLTFEDLLTTFTDVLDKFNQVVNGFTYSNMGLRYVNFIMDSDSNVSKNFLGFNLSGQKDIEDVYISKSETFQKTKAGAVRVRASTFYDKSEYPINSYMPPDLMTANNLLLFKEVEKSSDTKFTVLDIDHCATPDRLDDFSDIAIASKFRTLHDVIEAIFRSAVTNTAIKEWS